MARRSGKGWRLHWNDAAVRAKLQRACEAAINETMVDGVREFRGNHGGWVNRTGEAEASVQIQQPAATQGARTVGVWGSRGINYFRALEFEHGAALRSAADLVQPRLSDRIERRMA